MTPVLLKNTCENTYFIICIFCLFLLLKYECRPYSIGYATQYVRVGKN